MLDFLTVRLLYTTKEKDNVDNVIENFKNKCQFDIYLFISILISLMIAYIAYRCNENLGKATQIFYTIIAFLFSGIYFVFYLIYHILMGVPCP